MRFLKITSIERVMKNFCFFILISFISACSAVSLDEETVTFHLPPSHDFCSDEWNIRWVTSEGEVKERSLKNTVAAKITLPKNSVAAVIARPECKQTLKKVNVPLKDFLADKNCFAAIYPFSSTLDKSNSFAAAVFMQVALCAADEKRQVQKFMNSFNWRRFCLECAAFENPWLLDKERIVKAIASGNFKKSDLKESR